MGQYRRSQPDRRQYERPSWLRAQLRRRPRPLWVLITAHVLALGIALLLYALPHHVIPRAGVSVGLTSTRGGAVNATTPAPTTAADAEPDHANVQPDTSPDATTDVQAAVPTAVPEPTATPEPTPTPEPAEPVGSFRLKYADHFTSGEVQRTETSYRSANLDINMWTVYDESIPTRYYVADIYVADISCMATVLAQDRYGRGITEWPQDAAARCGGIVTLNGDYYGSRDGGIVIRNGTLYRNGKNMMDLCVLYWDGTMKTFDPFQFNAEQEIQNGAYQGWCFGPALMDGQGHAATNFNTTVKKANPRSVIGYYEPGHYCLVAVDGRSNKSKGMTIVQLAALMESLGCTQAYNLDGGQSSIMAAGTTVINKPIDGGRKSSDFIMVVDEPTQ